MKKATVYIDGFNLYYGALKNSKYKWLNLELLCQNLLKNNRVTHIKYFTARVSARPNDPQQPIRQQTYFRALQTLPNLEIIYGRYLQSKVMRRLANPPQSGSAYVEVIKTEEKGSDVNLAAHLVHDGHLGKYETAVFISNDSDLLEAIKIVRLELNLPVGMICPHKNPSNVLRANVDFIRRIRSGVLNASQFSNQLQDVNGVIHKPKNW